MLKMTEMCDKRAASIIREAIKKNLNIVVTGKNNTGKSLFLRSMISKVEPRFTIRTLDEYNEANLRDYYPERNILTIKKLPTSESIKLYDLEVLFVDSDDEELILKVLKAPTAQVLIATSKLTDDILEKLDGCKDYGLVIEMEHDDAGNPCVVAINEITSSKISIDNLYSKE